MTNKQAQELLIQNGQLVADTLRHLADNEIDSDYFAITSTSENGTEIEHELVITEYARQAAGTVDELVKALEAAEKRLSEITAPNMLLPVIDNLDENQLRNVIKTCTENYSLLHSQWEAAEKRIAELESEKSALRPVGVMSEKAFHRLEGSESRFIALWPRPGIYLPRKRPEDGVIVYARAAGRINGEG